MSPAWWEFLTKSNPIWEIYLLKFNCNPYRMEAHLWEHSTPTYEDIPWEPLELTNSRSARKESWGVICMRWASLNPLDLGSTYTLTLRKMALYSRIRAVYGKKRCDHAVILGGMCVCNQLPPPYEDVKCSHITHMIYLEEFYLEGILDQEEWLREQQRFPIWDVYSGQFRGQPELMMTWLHMANLVE